MFQHLLLWAFPMDILPYTLILTIWSEITLRSRIVYVRENFNTGHGNDVGIHPKLELNVSNIKTSLQTFA